MGYRIFLTDGINTVEMDTENIDTKTIFALFELQDVGTKKNNIQTLTFKGTKNNNEAFGYYFDFSKSTDLSDANKLFFNYNPIRAVKVVVYEDTELIFVGDLRLTEINVDKNSAVIYNCTVTTSLSILKNVLSDKYLRDLDFNFMQHRYCWNTIYNSWVDNNNAPELYDSATDTYSQTNQGYGVGYCYPIIDYGYRFNATTSTWSGNTIQASNIISLRNFKPAIFVNQYFDSIFNQAELNGFTYEIRGGTGFTNMFNQVVIPETNESTEIVIPAISATTTQEPSSYIYRLRFSGTDFTISNQIPYVASLNSNYNLPSVTQPIDGSNYFTGYTSGGKTIGLKALRTVQSSIKLEVDVDIKCYPYPPIVDLRTTTFTFSIRQITNTGENTLFTRQIIQPYNTTRSYNFEIYIEDVNIIKDSIIAPRLRIDTNMNPFFPLDRTAVDLDFNLFKLSIPGTSADTITYNVEPTDNCASSDLMIPKAPVNIKQLDFIKSIINQFNFVVYTENTNYKHIIFEPYDSFYYRTNPFYLISNSLDWTNKIDYSQGLTIKSNLELPKSYLFTYKSDEDFLNSFYKTKFNEIYGQFAFNDNLGLTQQKKVELIFSPTPMATVNNISKPLYYRVQNNTITPSIINPRIVYYNGYKLYNNTTGITTDSTYVGYEAINTTGIKTLFELDRYPQINNYYIVDNFSGTSSTIVTGYTVVNDIHFNQPREIYFINYNNKFLIAPNSYGNYFINQVTELTDENVIFVDCDVYLSEFDIANLDLSVPIYIQTGNNNAAYFKVINVEYENKDLPSRVKLQKIVI